MLIAVFLAPEFVPEYVDDFDNRIVEYSIKHPEFYNSNLYHPKYNLDYYPE